jgi:hypothetical protein
MALPEPQPGLVISYAYLWHYEYRAGRDEGAKDRPCVIILAIRSSAGGPGIVSVAPITHSEPDSLATAFELPGPVKRHLGLDAGHSWVILDEVNEFAWPGFDLRPISRSSDSFAYGLLPPRLFDGLMTQMRDVWRAGKGKAARRD